MRHQITVAIVAAALLSGCYWEPQRTEILVDTTPPGASCLLVQLGQPLTVVEPTPAIGVVALAPEGEVTVQCRRPGFADAAVTVPALRPAVIPGFIPNRRPGIDYQTRVDVALVPLSSGPPR